jgi:hypothetical protein
MEQHIDQVRKVFKKSGFNDKDIHRLASVLSRLEAEVGSSKCWNVGDVQVLDKAFTTSHAYHPCYKGKNVNPLVLAIYNIFPDEENGEVMLIRKSICKNYHCMNPRHLFYGDHIDLKIEKWKRKGVNIDKNKYTKVLWMYKNNSKSMSYRKLANEFDLNYNVVRSICNYERS